MYSKILSSHEKQIIFLERCEAKTNFHSLKHSYPPPLVITILRVLYFLKSGNALNLKLH